MEKKTQKVKEYKFFLDFQRKHQKKMETLEKLKREIERFRSMEPEKRNIEKVVYTYCKCGD